MILYTSDIEKKYEVNMKKSIGSELCKTALYYLVISLLCALFGAVYEGFSHGVYSYYMLYAFAIPLVGGTFPFLLAGVGNAEAFRNFRKRKADPIATKSWHFGIAALTVGSILQGILEIYGTTNRLIKYYLYAGVLLLLASVGKYILSRKNEG